MTIFWIKEKVELNDFLCPFIFNILNIFTDFVIFKLETTLVAHGKFF